MESIVKLLAFIAVGAYVVWLMFDGFSDLARRAEPIRSSRDPGRPPDFDVLDRHTLLSACCIVLLPRQFHVMVVENRDERDIATAAWIFPLYLIAVNVFVIPLAIAGQLLFPAGAINRDMTVLALPLVDQAQRRRADRPRGRPSAATAMVVVASVALSIMISNDLIVPALLRNHSTRAWIEARDLGALILVVRRVPSCGCC